MTAIPQRLQLSRGKGFHLQAASGAANGLACVNVARPARGGNPFRVEGTIERATLMPRKVTAADVVAAFRNLQEGRIMALHMPDKAFVDPQFLEALYRDAGMSVTPIDALLAEIRGQNVACWCALDAPCHGDVWLEFANR